MEGVTDESCVATIGPAAVRVDGEVTGSIDKGYVLLVGITHTDTEEDAAYIAKKIAGLRLWEDDEGQDEPFHP